MSYNIFYKTSSYYYITTVPSMSTLVETAGVSEEVTLGEQAQAPPTITAVVESSAVSREAEVAGAPTPPPEAPPPAPPPEAPPEADRRWLWLAGLAGFLTLIILLSRRRR